MTKNHLITVLLDLFEDGLECSYLAFYITHLFYAYIYIVIGKDPKLLRQCGDKCNRTAGTLDLRKYLPDIKCKKMG